MISFQCTNCDKHYSLADKFSGRKSKCKACGAAIKIPLKAPAFDEIEAEIEHELSKPQVYPTQDDIKPQVPDLETTHDPNFGPTFEWKAKPASSINLAFVLGVLTTMVALAELAFGLMIAAVANGALHEMTACIVVCFSILTGIGGIILITLGEIQYRVS